MTIMSIITLAGYLEICEGLSCFLVYVGDIKTNPNVGRKLELSSIFGRKAFGLAAAYVPSSMKGT